MALLLLAVMFCMSIMVTSAANEVKYSKEEYRVFYNASADTFLCNKKTLGAEVGKEYFMTYTVKSVADASPQQGILGTADFNRDYPYDEGGFMYYLNDTQELMLEGYTYFLHITITEQGFDYSMARAKVGQDPEYVFVFSEAGEKTDKMEYFGIWLASGATTAELEKVRFYDRDGNDLGVQVPKGKATVISTQKTLKDTKIDHRYDISVTDGANVAISNQLPTSAKKVYMEYKVEKVEGNLNQNGLIMSNSPQETYPFSTGLLQQCFIEEENTGGPLLTPGAEYVITFERGEKSFTGVVQKTLKGKTEFFVFPIKHSVYDPEAQYFSLWFGEGLIHPVSFVIRDFKCYDENKNNLKVQCNQSASIRHIGALEDYSGCEAVYYCEEDNSVYGLYKNQTLTYSDASGTQSGKYSISESVITINVQGREKEKTDYTYHTFTDSEGRVYKRLYNYKVNFVTGTDDVIETQVLNYENGFLLKEPDEPVMNNATFVGWYDANGKEYDFTRYVSKSETLYAKWEGADGKQFIAKEDLEEVDYTPYIAIGSSVGIVLVAGFVCILLIVRGKKYVNEK